MPFIKGVRASPATEFKPGQSGNPDGRPSKNVMQSGEAAIFTKAGVEQVFYSETLIGPLLPSLTYMLAFDSLADRDKKWAAFRGSMIGSLTRRNRNIHSKPPSPISVTLFCLLFADLSVKPRYLLVEKMEFLAHFGYFTITMTLIEAGSCSVVVQSGDEQ